MRSVPYTPGHELPTNGVRTSRITSRYYIYGFSVLFLGLDLPILHPRVPEPSRRTLAEETASGLRKTNFKTADSV